MSPTSRACAGARAAKKALRAANCRVGKVKRKTSSRKNRGRVVRQTVKPGSELAAGTKVALVVGKR